MTIGERIAKRRRDLNMTQEELAHKIGYKSKSTINKIETGINELSQTKIAIFSQALGVSPAYIMGWDEEKKTAASNELYSGLVNMSDKELDALFMQLIQNRDKDFLLRLASQILEIASNKGS